MSLLPQTVALSSLDSLVVVESLYNGILNRNGDSGGLDFWVGKLESGAVTVDNVAEAMFASPEAVDLYAGSSRAEIVEALYHQILGRDADAGGKAFYVDSHLSLADIAESLIGSPESVLHNGGALLGFEAAAVTGADFGGTGTLSDFAPVPPADHVTFSTEWGGVPTGTLKADGTFDSGAGTANNGFYSVFDHDAGAVLSIRSHERQSAGSDQAVSITETAPGHVVYEFNVDAGSQNSDGGVNPNRGDASLDFQVSKFLLSDPDHMVHFEFKSAIGTGNEKDISGNLVAVDDHTFKIVSSGTPGLADGTVLIGDFNPSSDHVSNSTNLGFGVFAGNPNVPAGDYSFEISLIDTTGANAGHVVSSITALMHASAEPVLVLGVIDHPLA
jgi:hypothetical protein